MRELEAMILSKGELRAGNILKVDSFLNHQIDIAILEAIGAEFHRIFGAEQVSKILTVEASGIAVALATGLRFRVPVVFAKKSESLNLDAEVHVAEIYSYTKQKNYQIKVSKRYLEASDRVLIVDDFLARGSAVNGLLELCRAAQAQVVGIGAVIEKCFQGGGDELRQAGYNLHSLAMLEQMSPEAGLVFRANPDHLT